MRKELRRLAAMFGARAYYAMRTLEGGYDFVRSLERPFQKTISDSRDIYQHYDDREAARGGDEGEAQGGREQRIAKPAEEVAPAQGGEERHDGQEEEQSQRHRREKLCRLPRARCARLHVSFPARKP